MENEFTDDELKRIIFPVNTVICRSCHKPRINKKLSVENFSQQHQAKICTVGKYHGKYNQNNEQNIVPNNVQNNGQNNPQNIAPNNAPFEIQNVENVHVVHNIGPNFSKGVNEYIHNNKPNARNYVTREEFIEFKGLINDRFDRLKRSIQALSEKNFNDEERKKRKR